MLGDGRHHDDDFKDVLIHKNSSWSDATIVHISVIFAQCVHFANFCPL